MTMLMTITTNLADVRRQLAGLERQVNFASSKALNDTAREVRKAIPAGLRRILADTTPVDAWGDTRSQRLAHVFAFWRDLAERIAPRGVAVAPCVSLASETRALDRAWQGRGA